MTCSLRQVQIEYLNFKLQRSPNLSRTHHKKTIFLSWKTYIYLKKQIESSVSYTSANGVWTSEVALSWTHHKNQSPLVGKTGICLKKNIKKWRLMTSLWDSIQQTSALSYTSINLRCWKQFKLSAASWFLLGGINFSHCCGFICSQVSVDSKWK